MFKNKRILAIPELKLAGKIEYMSEEQLEGYLRSLESFIENFPANEKNLKTSLEAKDYKSMAKHLATIGDMLAKIYADNMALECKKQIIELKNAKHEKIEAFTIYFLKSISMLSIDIQMAGHKGLDSMPIAGNSLIAGGKSILAVDDTEFFLRTLKSLLQGTEYKLTCTTSGATALKFLQKNHPDLFILDIDMPEMDGYELAQKIRASGQTAPIIFLTGNSTRESVEKALKAGAADFIVKPISRAQVLERITKFA